MRTKEYELAMALADTVIRCEYEDFLEHCIEFGRVRHRMGQPDAVQVHMFSSCNFGMATSVAVWHVDEFSLDQPLQDFVDCVLQRVEMAAADIVSQGEKMLEQHEAEK